MNDYDIKRMVFHFYIPKCWRELDSVKIHLACIEEYSHVFDEIIFRISVDDENDTETIEPFKHELLSRCHCKSVCLKVVKNDFFRESKTLYDEIITRLDKLEGLTFFGHSKGVGNEITFGKTDSAIMKDISIWIIGMYFLSFSAMWEVEAKLRNVIGITYGPFKTSSKSYANKNHWVYSGTFYWINTNKLYNYIKRNNIEYRGLNDRFYSELVLGDILPFQNTDVKTYVNDAASFNGSYLAGDDIDYYCEIENYLKILLSEYNLNEFYKFYNKILKKCEIEYQQ